MALAIFGIDNSGLNLAVSLVILMLVVLWLALVVYTYTDARRRISDPFLVACATVASFFPFIGTAVYTIVRPPEFLEDAHERELEIKAAELRVRQLAEQSCPNCEYPVEKNYLRCPNCQRRLKDPCPSCGKPVDPRWSLCPYCESALAERRRSAGPPERREPAERRSAAKRGEPERREARRKPAAPKRQPQQRKKASPGPGGKPSAETKKDSARGASTEAPGAKPQQRSPSRESDPDPRQA